MRQQTRTKMGGSADIRKIVFDSDKDTEAVKQVAQVTQEVSTLGGFQNPEKPTLNSVQTLFWEMGWTGSWVPSNLHESVSLWHVCVKAKSVVSYTYRIIE